jgi:hypothetical protein
MKDRVMIAPDASTHLHIVAHVARGSVTLIQYGADGEPIGLGTFTGGENDGQNMVRFMAELIGHVKDRAKPVSTKSLDSLEFVR